MPRSGRLLGVARAERSGSGGPSERRPFLRREPPDTIAPGPRQGDDATRLLVSVFEQIGEGATGHLRPHVEGVARLVEHVGVDVERGRDPGVAEDAADLGDIEAQVDDQVAGEGVAQVVEAKPRPAIVGELHCR